MTKHQKNAKDSGACIRKGQEDGLEAIFIVLDGAKRRRDRKSRGFLEENKNQQKVQWKKKDDDV